MNGCPPPHPGRENGGLILSEAKDLLSKRTARFAAAAAAHAMTRWQRLGTDTGPPGRHALEPSMLPSRLARACGLLSAVFLGAMAGCQPAGTPESPPRETAGSANAPAAQARISGTVLYRERVLLPPNARLQVQLIDSLLADTPRAVLAETTTDKLGAPPIAFALDYDPSTIRDSGMYGLHAALYGPDGALLFVTDTRQAVAPGSDVPVQLLLKHVVVGAAKCTVPDDAAGSDVLRKRWQCGELRVDVDHDATTRTATLSFSGRRLVLAETPAASGTRHADDAGNEFRVDGDGATLTLAGQAQTECTRSDTPSPWTDAAERKVGFRAVGNEPGWWVEVGMGEAPAIKAVLDYGERRLEVAHAQAVGPGYAGSTVDGVAVRLRIERAPARTA